jgi:hypothetical protein
MVEGERELTNGDSCLEVNEYESKDQGVCVYSSIYDGGGGREGVGGSWFAKDVEERNGGWARKCSVSGTGADDKRQYIHAVRGASNRVITSGTWCLSNS